MLKTRVITALVLFIAVLAALFGLERTGFALAAGVVFTLAGWEWSGMMGRLSLAPRLLWVASLVVLFFLTEWFQPTWLYWLSLWWLVALLMVVVYPKAATYWYRPAILMLFGWLLLVPTFEAMVALQDQGAMGLAGPFALLFILFWVWAADTGAYFAGRAFGKHKLAPQVSPGKTIEGLIGGVVLAMLVTLGVVWLAPVEGNLWLLLLVAFITVLASALGDLFESLAKRKANLKDSSHILPGHGGLLDRIDSLTAALPVALTLLTWFALPGGGIL